MIFTCGECRSAPEEYRAVGNIPKHAHLCRSCWYKCIDKQHFVSVEARHLSKANAGFKKPAKL